MIYSEWQPSGGYRYYEAVSGVPINDDQPVPRLGAGNEIGVSSLVAGRTVPRGATVVGEGYQAVGMIAPTARHGHLAGTDMTRANTAAVYGILGLGLVAVAIIWTRG